MSDLIAKALAKKNKDDIGVLSNNVNSELNKTTQQNNNISMLKALQSKGVVNGD